MWPGWRGFVSHGHPSGALEVTVGIVKEFARTATARGQASLVVTFPTVRSYEAYLNRGEIAYQKLLDMISSEGVVVVDFHEAARDYLAGRRICELLTNSTGCFGHFNPEGNELVADTIYRKINEEGLLPSK